MTSPTPQFWGNRRVGSNGAATSPLAQALGETPVVTPGPDGPKVSQAELDHMHELMKRAPMVQESDTALLKRIADSLERVHPAKHVIWPQSGSPGFLVAGENIFDFENGYFFPADDNGREEMHGQGVMSSVHLHPMTGGAFSVEVIGLEDESWTNVLPFFMNWQHHVIHHMRLAKMRVWVVLPMAFFVQAADEPDSAPVEPIGDVGTQSWSGDLTTTDNFAATVMRPGVFNPRTGVATTLSAARAGSDVDGLLIQSAQAINSLFIARRAMTWVIHNTGSADADVALQGAMNGNPTRYIDDQETNRGPGLEFLVLPAGDELELETQGYYLFQRLRARSSVGGASTTLEVQARGLVGTG